MGRRQFMKQQVAGTAILAASGLVHKASAENLPSPDPERPDVLDVDVLVVGGGSAGHVAAIQAGRLGAKTVLLERNSQLGGTTTTGGVSFPGLFHAWGKQIIAGIGWELVAKSVEIDGRKLQDFTVVHRSHVPHHVRLNGQLYSLLAEEACLDAGVSLAYYQFPQKVVSTEDGWLVDVVGQGVQYQLRCRQIVDCTGGAEIVGMLGMERLREDTGLPVQIHTGNSLFAQADIVYQLQQPDMALRLTGIYTHGDIISNHRDFCLEVDTPVFIACQYGVVWANETVGAALVH